MSIDYAESGGVKPSINKKLRRCIICGKILSVYNLNKYCFSHINLKESPPEERLKAKQKVRIEKQKRNKTPWGNFSTENFNPIRTARLEGIRRNDK